MTAKDSPTAPTAPSALTDLLGIEHPIVQGPFGGGLSTVELAATVSESGGLGSFGAHHLAPEEIPAVVAKLRAATGKPFAVNLWVSQPGDEIVPAASDFDRYVAVIRPYLDELGLPEPDRTGPFVADYAAQIDALLQAAPPVLSFVMGIPSGAVLAEARRRGIVTIGTATTVDEAIAIEDAGMDAVVASGSDAGGHRGAFLRPVAESLVGTFSLVPQVADAVSIPVIAAGGIADGRGIAAALALGADGVQIGTGFLATAESGASAVHKAALHSPQARRTVLTRLYSGKHGRAVPNRLIAELDDDAVAPYPVQGALMLPIRREAARRGITGLVNLWAGQAAPLTGTLSAAAYFSQLVEAAGGRSPSTSPVSRRRS